MNKLGLPRKKGEDSLGRCVVCEALEAIWAIPYDLGRAVGAVLHNRREG